MGEVGIKQNVTTWGATEWKYKLLMGFPGLWCAHGKMIQVVLAHCHKTSPLLHVQRNVLQHSEHATGTVSRAQIKPHSSLVQQVAKDHSFNY